ncbi:MAG: ABC transporter permease [Micrococcales bacterium]|nr:ABC transporter permease [Micrococcales bacterium]
MTATTDPARGAAPTATRVRAQAVFETLTFLRNGEQLLVSVILPALAMVGLYFTTSPSLGDGRRIDLAVPGVLALCVISAAFTGTAIQTAFDRRYGVLRLLGTTPLGRGGLVLGKTLAVLAVLLVQLAVLGGLGLALGWRPVWSGLPAALVTILLGAWAFVALAMVLAGTLRPEAVLALANLIWVLLLGLGGVLVPPDRMPGALQHLATALPSGALGEGLRAAFVHGSVPWAAWGVLLLWAGLCTALAARLFRWSD